MTTESKKLNALHTVLTDFVERTTHWQEGGADRHAAKQALADLGELVDSVEWVEKGLAEWRTQYTEEAIKARAARATARIAITHLQAVLNKPRTHAEQQTADTAARDWLESIESSPA